MNRHKQLYGYVFLPSLTHIYLVPTTYFKFNYSQLFLYSISFHGFMLIFAFYILLHRLINSCSNATKFYFEPINKFEHSRVNFFSICPFTIFIIIDICLIFNIHSRIRFLGTHLSIT